MSARSRVVSAVLSALLPGGGHFVLGEVVRGSIFATLGTLLLLVLPLALVPMLWALAAIRVAAIADVLVGVRRVRPLSVIGVVLTGASPIGVLVVYRAVGFSIYKVPSSSMMPTVAIGQRLIVNRLAYVLEDPTPGDVITFGNPCAPAKVFVKRVVALAGDSVEVRCSFLYVNDVAVPEVLVEEAACAYDDFDAFSDRWSRPGCARYREQLGGSHDTFHDEERPARDRELDAARRDGTATYFDPNYDVGFGDDHDFPRLPDPEPGRLRMQTSAGPELPRCPTSQERRPPELLGHVEVLTSAAGEPPKWEPWLDRPWPAAGFPGPADACAPRARYRVPPGTVFVLGDNRDNASDSRVWGPVPRSMVTGEVVLIVGAGGP